MEIVKKIIKNSVLYPVFHNIKIFYINLFPLRSISKTYKKFYQRELNWENLMYLSEKMQFLKWYVYPNLQEVVKGADKYTLHEYLSSKGLSNYSVPYLDIYTKPSDLDFEKLPSQFVMKKTNASGLNLIVKDKKDITEQFLKLKIKEWLKIDYGKKGLEPHYSKSSDRVICEPFYKDLGNEYRLFMVDGKIGFIQIIIWDWDQLNNGEEKISKIIEGHRKHYRVHYDENWNLLWKDEGLPSEILIKPVHWNELKQISEKIAKDFPVVRVDFNEINNQIKITELTFTPANGFLEILKQNPELDLTLGKRINMRQDYEKNSL